MKKILAIILLAILVCIIKKFNCNAQYWAKTYGGIDHEWVDSVQRTSDDGYIVIGRTRSFGEGDINIWLLKLDSSGGVQWEKSFGRNYYYSLSPSAQQTSDGGYIIAGHTLLSSSGYDIWILKLDSTGGIQWQKTYGGTALEYSKSIQQTSDGGYIVASGTHSFGPGSGDFWILKLDSTGGVQWEKTYGGIEQDSLWSAQQTTDGGYIVTGRTESFGAGSGDIWILKLDSTGGIQWQKIYGGTGDDSPQSIQQTSDGGYIVAGATNSFGSGISDIWILKLDSTGGIQWQKTYGDTGGDSARSIQQTSDGGYIVAGSTSSFETVLSDIWLLKLDSIGSIQWQKTYGGTNWEYAYSVQQTSEGGYIVAGDPGPSETGFHDFLVLRLDSNGNIPGCDLIGTSDAIVTETTVEGENTNITTINSSAIINDTSISPRDSLCNISTICFGESDSDEDGIPDFTDNCPDTPNEDQTDSFPPGGNGIGNACECEGNFNCSEDDDCDGSDAATFKIDFGRSVFNTPCVDGNPCNGDFICDGDVDGTDAALFKQDFGRSAFSNPCPMGEAGIEWCSYPVVP